MKDILYKVTNGNASRIFNTKSSAEGWLAEEIRYTGLYDNPDAPEILAKNIVNTGSTYTIKGKTFGIAIR